MIKFTNNLIEEIKIAGQKAIGIFKKNIEMKEKSQYFNEKALGISLEFALLSLQCLNVIGIEELLEEEKDIKELVAPILGFNLNAFETILALEFKIEKFPQANTSSIDFIDLSKKFFKVLPLFFWWVSSSSKENCDVLSSYLADHWGRCL